MLECKILTSESEVEALADEWRQLYARLGNNPFANYDPFAIWWSVIGKTNKGRRLFVVAGYEKEKLMAILPLTIIPSRGLRIMQAAGYRTYNYCDMLAETPEQAVQLWQAARSSSEYDFADIRDVYPESLCYAALASFARQRDLTDAYFLRFKWPTGDDWITSLKSHTRIHFRRGMRRLEEKGPVRFEISRGKPLPAEIVDDIIKHKVSWSIARKKRGFLENSEAGSYIRRSIDAAAENGSLFLGWLKCGEQTIGYNQGFIHKGVLHGVIWTYDPAWAAYSPGNLVLMNAIMWAINNGLQGVDLRQGSNQFKRLHSNEKRQCAEFTFSSSTRGRLLEWTYMTARDIVRQAKSGAKRLARKKS